MLRPEQKQIALMCKILGEFRKPSGIVRPPLVGAVETAKAYLLELRHRRFSGFGAGNHCVTATMPSLLMIFAQQGLIDQWDIVESEEIENLASRYLGREALSRKCKRRCIWVVLSGQRFVQSVPEPICMLLSQYILVLELLEMARLHSSALWSERWHYHLRFADEWSLLTYECSIYDITVDTSSKLCTHASDGCFKIQAFGKDKTIEHYGTLVCREFL